LRCRATSVLKAVEGAKTCVRHLWRFARSSGLSPDRRAASTSTAEGPGTEKRHEVQVEDDEECDCSGGLHGGYSVLSRRLRLLEAQFQELRAERYSFVPHESAVCSRALLISKHKLGMELEKPLPWVAFLNKYRDAHAVSQISLSVDIDSTLDEFIAICGLATSMSLRGTTVHPWFLRSSSFRVPSSYRIMLERYQDL
jgi:hypothetical protein